MGPAQGLVQSRGAAVPAGGGHADRLIRSRVPGVPEHHDASLALLLPSRIDRDEVHSAGDMTVELSAQPADTLETAHGGLMRACYCRTRRWNSSHCSQSWTRHSRPLPSSSGSPISSNRPNSSLDRNNRLNRSRQNSSPSSSRLPLSKLNHMKYCSVFRSVCLSCAPS